MAAKRGTATKPKARVQTPRGKKIEQKPTDYDEAVAQEGARKSAAKADKPPRAGHNIAQFAPDTLTDAQFQALTYLHKGRLKDIVAQINTLVAQKRNILKAMKADGVDADLVRLLIKLETPTGEKALRADLSRGRLALEWEGKPVGTQGELFPPDREPAVDKAYQEGKVAGMEGKDASPPYAPGTEQGQRWMAGWHDGQEAQRELLKQKISEQKAVDEKEFDAAPEPEVEDIGA